MNEISYRPIGIIHSPFKEPRGTPIQPAGAVGAQGVVEVFPEYTQGLKDLDGFSHIMLLYHFHRAKPSSLVAKPYMGDEAHGIFAVRAPARPNPIGVSVVRLLRAEENVLHIQDVDIVEGTPLLDIKPYVPQFDVRDVEKIGWLEKNVHKVVSAKDDGKFAR
jgi:tRNA-Thr(GGU) m(6)t(6)A37 methyltransferase TsaA